MSLVNDIRIEFNVHVRRSVKIEEWLKMSVAALPKERREPDYIEFLNQTFRNFLEELKTIEVTGPITEKIIANIYKSEVIAESIMSAVAKYYAGHPGEAYEELWKGITEIRPFIRSLVADSVNKDDLRNLYRIRKKNEGRITKKDMFHIPYELRHLVSSQRYSIPGFPSLYLGSSLYIAWRELGCPDLNSIVVSRVETIDNVKILDFGYAPQYEPDIYRTLETHHKGEELLSEQYVSRIICWPLIAACSIKVMHKQGHFKPEYIIPQLLLQLIRNDVIGEDVDGIRYFSMNTDDDIPSLLIHNNFVFPVKQSKPTGQCDILKRKFFLTEPASWQLLNLIYEEPEYPLTSDAYIQLVRGIDTRYRSTDFAKIEARLIALPAARVK